MILFGHLGLTYAVARNLDIKVVKKVLKIDYRLMFLGSILPDVLDKTIIFVRSNGTFKSGRLFGHTFIFTLILFIIGQLLWKKKKSIGVLVISAGCVIHQLLDSMWNYLDIYFWPIYGFPLSKGNISFKVWLQYSINVFNKENPELSFLSLKERLISNPVISFSEVIGFIIILVFVIKLVKFKQINRFVKSGQFNFSGK